MPCHFIFHSLSYLFIILYLITFPRLSIPHPFKNSCHFTFNYNPYPFTPISILFFIPISIRFSVLFSVLFAPPFRFRRFPSCPVCSILFYSRKIYTLVYNHRELRGRSFLAKLFPHQWRGKSVDQRIDGTVYRHHEDSYPCVRFSFRVVQVSG